MTCKICIGTSGYHYSHWRGPFYPVDTPASKMLAYYSKYFDTLELNNSFYRLPTMDAFENWRNITPKGFVFSVKASRFLTHNKKLKDPENALHNLLPRAAGLGEKLGPILFQLPPRWQVNPERLEAFLEVLPRTHHYAFELRDITWMRAEIEQLLDRYACAFCIYELAGYHSPLTVTTDFAYVRLHGPGQGKYKDSYDENRLRRWADQIGSWAKSLRAIFVYFDNDEAGFAIRNALALKQMLS